MSLQRAEKRHAREKAENMGINGVKKRHP